MFHIIAVHKVTGHRTFQTTRALSLDAAISFLDDCPTLGNFDYIIEQAFSI
jgi:hypothetical protein